MINDKIYKNLGIAVLAIIAIYIVLKGFNYQTRLIEKLANKTDEETSSKETSIEKVRQQTKMLSDEVIKREETSEVLHSEYLMELDELISFQILNYLTSDDFTKNIFPNIGASMSKLNELNKFRQTISDAANAWDNRNK